MQIRQKITEVRSKKAEWKVEPEIREAIEQRKPRKRKWMIRGAVVMSCMMVFVTTYSLIIPAITAEKSDLSGPGEAVSVSAAKADAEAGDVKVGDIVEIKGSDAGNADAESGGAKDVDPSEAPLFSNAPKETEGETGDLGISTENGEAAVEDEHSGEPSVSDNEGTDDAHLGIVVETGVDAADASVVLVAEQSEESGVQLTPLSVDEETVTLVDAEVAEEHPDLEEEVHEILDGVQEEEILDPDDLENLKEQVETTLEEITSPGGGASENGDIEAEETEVDPSEQTEVVGEASSETDLTGTDIEMEESDSDAEEEGILSLVEEKILEETVYALGGSCQAEADGVFVCAQFGQDVFPEDVEMKAETVEAEDYSEAVEQATGKTDAEVKTLDISFWADGTEVEPRGEVRITFQADFIDEKAEPEVLHFDEDGEVTVLDTVVKDDEIVLKTDRFSVYAIVYTVHFESEEYELSVSGEDYTITLTYGPEAGIPEGAALEAEEILEGTEEYDNYFQETLEELNGSEEDGEETIIHSIEYARFFDISILCEGEKIEPAAPVSVQITYSENSIGQWDDLSVVHFAESGTEFIEATTNVLKEETEITFEQNSFSVTGTIVDTVSITDGDYYIVHFVSNEQKWYALASDGSYVDVTAYYDAGSSSIIGYEGTKNISWTVSASGNSYTIKAKDENKYLTLNGSVVGTTSGSVNIHTGSSGSKNAWISIDDQFNYWGSNVTYRKRALGWNNGYVLNSNGTARDFLGVTYYTNATPTDVQFAKLSDNSEVLDSNYPNRAYNEEQLQTWLDQALNDEPLKDVLKQGYVYDYDNRIYQIDFSAKSGVLAMASDISLGFVTDVSNSMLFPSALTPVTSQNFTNSSNTFGSAISLNTTNLNKLKHSNNEVYFTIGDKSGTSTVYALWYGTTTAGTGWHAMDASYWARWKAGVMNYSDSGVSSRDYLISNSTGNRALHKNDSTDSKANSTSVKSGVTYTIYTANSEYFDGINHKNIYDMSDGGKYGIQDDGTMSGSYNMGNRLYYLESSVASAVGDLRTIAKEYPLGAVYAALETFASQVYGRQPYLKIGGITNDMDSANATYKTNYETLYGILKDLKGYDGTRQDLALSDSTFFGTNGYINSGEVKNTTKYVILITDGAPNGTDVDTVISKAQALKNAGINVITVGLSVEDVKDADRMLYWSASGIGSDGKIITNPTNPSNLSSVPSSSDDRLFYWAKTGDDLKWILRDIVRTVMKEATVSSTIQDEIQSIFYPVDANGVPLTDKSWINLNGEKVNAGASDAAGYVTYNSSSDTWTVKWTDQATSWNGWHGTIYVKTKEDFMGGNNVSTNVKATVTPTKYTVVGDQGEKSASFTAQQQADKQVKPATPYVNVDELHMTENSTGWTVYLGTEVDPKTELEELWKKILVNTVIKTDGLNTNYTEKTAGDMIYSTSRSDKATADADGPTSGNAQIALSHYNIDDSVFTNLLNQLKDGNTESEYVSEEIKYSPYGQGEVGTFIVKLEKKVNDEAKEDAPDTHETKKAEDAVETYILTVTYQPKSEADRLQDLIDASLVEEGDEDYQHHGGRGAAKETTGQNEDEVKSTNKHIINVFAKGFQITKTNEDYSKTLTGSEFTLYRTARAGETENILTIEGNRYVPVVTLDTSDGTATLDPVEKLNAGEKYYLVETKAPAGYNLMASPIEVKLDITDSYTPKPGTTEQSSRPASGIYDWTETATLNFEGSGFQRTNAVGEDVSNTGITADSTTELLYFKIMNNPGYELPSTGGSGTHPIYLLGLLLMCLAGAGLILRRKQQNTL